MVSNQIKTWIAKGYAAEITPIIMAEDRVGDLDKDTLLLELQNAALDNVMHQWNLDEIDPSISAEQLDSALEAATVAQIRNTVSDMVDSGLLEASLNEEGEVVYATTAKGAAYADMIEDKFMSEEDFNKKFKEGKL